MVDSIASVLKRRDGISQKEADERVEELRDELYRRLSDGESPFDLMDDVCLEPDYLEELI